jgi:bacterioferritin-associated ferredoxin
VSALEGYERGTLAPLIKCVRCDSQARLVVENSLMAGLGAVCAVCVDHALEICRELGDSLGAQLIAEKMRAL